MMWEERREREAEIWREREKTKKTQRREREEREEGGERRVG